MVKIVETPVLETRRPENDYAQDIILDDLQSVGDLYNEDARKNDLNQTAIRDVCCCCTPCCCCAAAVSDPVERP